MLLMLLWFQCWPFRTAFAHATCHRAQTKLANSVYTVVLDKKLRAMQSKVKAMVVTPGLAATNLQVRGLDVW
jgi:hypothetical protein